MDPAGNPQIAHLDRELERVLQVSTALYILAPQDSRATHSHSGIGEAPCVTGRLAKVMKFVVKQCYVVISLVLGQPAPVVDDPNTRPSRHVPDVCSSGGG